MGLLEKAGKIKDDEKPKKAVAKAKKSAEKPVKAAKAKPKPVKKEVQKREKKERAPRVARVMPDDFLSLIHI